MKRGREEEREFELANCLMLLSKVGQTDETRFSGERLFACKTCNRKFLSSQALGGHRASHKKPKLMREMFLGPSNSPPKPKTHECSICGVEFPIGQALGGHMRKHRSDKVTAVSGGSVTRPLLAPVVPVLNRSNSKRITCLDLNLTPVENELKLQLIA